VEGAALLVELVQLARNAGIEVREIASGRAGDRDPDAIARSGACRVRDRVFALLAPGDSMEDRIAVVAAALAMLGADWLESQYLPPALRARIETALRDA
jgi:hypothetical protein